MHSAAHQDINVAIQDTAATAVMPICAVLAAVYGVLAIAHPIFTLSSYAYLMSFVAAISSIVILLISKYWRGRGTNEHVHLVMAVLSFIVLFNVVLNTIVDPQIERSIFFIAYLITVSLLVLSRWLFFCLMLFLTISWLLFVFIFEFPPESIKFWSWLMFVGSAVSIMLNDQRQRAVLRSATEEMQLRKHGLQLSELLKANELALADSNGMFKKLAQASFEELAVHRFGIWIFSADEMQLECQFFASSFSGQGVEVALLERPVMPKYFDALQENRIISAVDAVTDERTLELVDYLKEKSIVSMLDGPIVVRGQVVGVVCNESVNTRKQWTIEEQTFAASVADIAALVIQSKERAELERRTLEAERLESLGILAGGVAHDFNNILTVILGHAEILQSMLAENPDALESVNSIAKAGGNAKDLASHMLNYSGRGTFLTTVVNLTAVVQDFCSGGGSEFFSDGILQINAIERPLPVKLESSKIHQVLLNLVINARDAGACNISLSTGRTPGISLPIAELVTTEKLDANDYAWFEVVDDGEGLSDEVLSKMFDPFYSTKEFGSGLGLANVLGILRAHFGSVRVRSSFGEGTSIRVYLPIDESELTQEVLVSRPEEAFATKNWQVLLVEDDPRVRQISRQLLENEGSKVVAFESYTDFATRLDDIDVSKLDVALVDLTLGDGDGVEVITVLHRARPDLPEVLMSGYDASLALSRLNHETNAVFFAETLCQP
jgi:signal transduction histidine kinase